MRHLRSSILPLLVPLLFNSCVWIKATPKISPDKGSHFWRVETLDSGVLTLSNVDASVSGAPRIAYNQGLNLKIGFWENSKFQKMATPLGMSPKKGQIILASDLDSRPHLIYPSPSGLNYVWKSSEGWTVGMITDRAQMNSVWDLKLVNGKEPIFIFEDNFGSMISFERQGKLWKEGSVFKDFKVPRAQALCVALSGGLSDPAALVQRTSEGVYLGVSQAGKAERFLVKDNAVGIQCRLAWDGQGVLHGVFLTDKELLYGVLAKGRFRLGRIEKFKRWDESFEPFDLGLDKHHQPHVVFCDASKKFLEYRFKSQRTSRWIKAPGIALESLLGPPKVFVGQDAKPWIFFIDGQSLELRLARGAGLP